MSHIEAKHDKIAHRDVTTWLLCGLLLAAIAVISVSDGIIEKLALEFASTPAPVRQPAKITPQVNQAVLAPEVLDQDQKEQAQSLLNTADQAQALVKGHVNAVQSRSGACGQAARDGFIPATARAQWECMLGVGPYALAVKKVPVAMAGEATVR